MNTSLFWAYIAIGMVSKWLTMKRPTPGEKAVAIPVIVAGALVVAWIIPQELNAAVIPVLAVFHGGEVIGRILSIGIDKVRVGLAVSGWRTKLSQVANGITTKRNR